METGCWCWVLVLGAVNWRAGAWVLVLAVVEIGSLCRVLVLAVCVVGCSAAFFSGVKQVPVCALELPLMQSRKTFCMFLLSGVYAGVIFVLAVLDRSHWLEVGRLDGGEVMHLRH